MINYIQHDEEFLGVIKLINGEQIVGKCLAVEEDPSKTLIFISDPCEIEYIELPQQSSKTQKKVGISFKKWMPFSDEEFHIIPEDKIISISPMSKESAAFYMVHIMKENKNEEDSKKIELTKGMGKISTVSEARRNLERIFKI
jgi:hypothetical protein